MSRIVTLTLIIIATTSVTGPAVDATAAEQQQKSLTISNAHISFGADGITLSGDLEDDVRLCVAPRTGGKGKTQCFTLGEIRRGDVVSRARRGR